MWFHPLQQRKLEAEQWVRRVEAAKAQAHPDRVVNIAAELDTLKKEVDVLIDIAPTLPIITTPQLLQLKDVRFALSIQRVLISRTASRMDFTPSVHMTQALSS